MKIKLFQFLAILLLTVPCGKFTSESKFSNNNNNETSISNSRDALDWQGIYVGTAPCEFCDETKILIELNENLTFKMQTLNAGETEIKNFEGKFSWDEKGRTVKLQLPVKEKIYLVGENILILLDAKNNPVKNKQSENYSLNKTTNEITEKYWKLIELNGAEVAHSEGFRQEPHIIFTVEENIVFGNGGCNNFSGSFEFQQGNRIKISQVISTQMACLDMEIESQLFQLFPIIDNFTVSSDGRFLSLNRARMAPLARFEVVYLQP